MKLILSLLLAGAVVMAQSPVNKRFVIRVPDKWNGDLVIGAHGGSGGDAIDRSGKKYATTETALDDVIGDYAFKNGFAYASVDRDGIGNSKEGVDLTLRFIEQAKDEVRLRASRSGETASRPNRTYVVGLSAGGGIARTISEMNPSAFDSAQASPERSRGAPVVGALIIAGAGGDVVTRMDRNQRIAALWPLIDPRAHAGLADNDPRIVSYAEAVGTPVAARRLWPYVGTSTATAKPITGTIENSTAKPSIPVIEVVGTWDDLTIREIRAYRDRVEPKERHRLYQVEGVWHMSGNDDGVAGFQYAAETRMKLDKDVADAMGEGPSYIPTVQDAFDLLVRWVEKGSSPPVSQTVKPGSKPH